MTTTTPIAPATGHRGLLGRTARVAALALAAGLLWWLVGHLGWLLMLTLRADFFEPNGLPDGLRSVLPVGRSLTPDLVLGSLVGGTIAGLLSRWPRSEPARFRLPATALGAAVALGLTLAQSLQSLRAAGESYAGHPAIVAGLIGGVALCAALGWLVGAAVWWHPIAIGVALAVTAGLLPMWLSRVVWQLAPGHDMPLSVWRWMAPLLVAAAIVVVGARPLWRVSLWPVLLAVGWVVEPAVVASHYLTMVLRFGGITREMAFAAIAEAWDYFLIAIAPDVRDAVPWVVAVLLAAIVVVSLQLREGAVAGAASSVAGGDPEGLQPADRDHDGPDGDGDKQH